MFLSFASITDSSSMEIFFTILRKKWLVIRSSATNKYFKIVQTRDGLWFGNPDSWYERADSTQLYLFYGASADTLRYDVEPGRQFLPPLSIPIPLWAKSTLLKVYDVVEDSIFNDVDLIVKRDSWTLKTALRFVSLSNMRGDSAGLAIGGVLIRKLLITVTLWL